METKDGDSKSLTYYMRTLHRDIGFLVLGLTIVYALSGVVLIYRETDFLKSAVAVETTLSPQMSPDDLARKLHARRFEVTKIDGDTISFKDGASLQNGVYERNTGTTRYVEKKLPPFLQRLIQLHKISTSKSAHWIAVFYGLSLLFLAVSSLGMYKPKSRQFKRGIILSALGVALTFVILFLL